LEAASKYDFHVVWYHISLRTKDTAEMESFYWPACSAASSIKLLPITAKS